jgi:hypothetical protein
VLDGCISKIKDDGSEASGLQQQVCSLEGLIKTSPRLVFTEIGSALMIRGIPATNPKQLIQANTIGRRRFGIKRIMRVDPCANACFCSSLCEERYGNASSSGGGRACDLADRANRKPA